MFRRIVMHALIHAAGSVVAIWYLVNGLFAPPDRSHWHGLGVILAIGWVFGYWGIVGAFGFRRRWNAMLAILQHIGERIQADQDPSPGHVAEVVETVTDLAASENGIPKFILRPFVRKGAARMIENARAEARAKREAEAAAANPVGPEGNP